MAEQVTRTIIVKAPVSEVYQIWANFENFPHFMKNMESVTKTGDGLSHWVMKGPLGKKLEWDARTTRMDQNIRIAWNSLDGGDIKTSGQVTFKELPANETEIAVTLQYVPPGGKIGEVLSHVFDDPERKLEEDLNNFKHYAEHTTGHKAYEVGDNTPGRPM
jgi:uncharacterized membrane protein